MSKNPEFIDVTVSFERDAKPDEDAPLRAAVLKTRALLTTWRSRFTAGQDSGPVSSTYTLETATVDLHSDGPERVRVEHVTHEDGRKAVYTFNGYTGDIGVESEPVGGDAAPDTLAVKLQLHDELAGILFACDKREVRG